MPTLTLAAICDGITTTLAAAPGIVRAQSFDELTEDYPDLPLLQVYWEGLDTDARADNDDRSSFGAGVRVTEVEIRCDVPCRQRSHLDEDMAEVVAIADALCTTLETQDRKAYFGVAGIKGFRWSMRRVNFERGDPLVVYPGLRLTLFVRVF